MIKSRLAAMTTFAAAAASLAGCSLLGETEYDYQPVDFGAVGDLTPPATDLSFGEVAWVEQETEYTSSDGESETVAGIVGISVLDVVTGDASFFDQYANSDDFEGYTPYFIVLQFQWNYQAPFEQDPHGEAVFPLTADGEDLEFLTAGAFGRDATSEECPLKLPGYDPETNVGLQCVIGLSTDKPVELLEYNGEEYSALLASGDNEYLDAPIRWTAGSSEQPDAE